MERSEIPLAARVELAHAQIQAVARRHGVDALLVKGWAADPRLYVQGRVSSDVDVLTRPSHAGRMVQALESGGWATVSTFRSGSIFRHAQTMRHPQWGLVDIHRSFPGFEMNPSELFEQLWTDRVEKHVAGYPCEVPALLDHALLIVVHAARSPESLRQDVGHLATVLTAEDWRALEERAQQLHATVAYAAATGQLPRYRSHPSHDLWLVLSQEGSRSQEWRARLRAATSAREKLRVLLGAPLPNVDHLRMDLGREPTIRDITRATLNRPFVAATELLSGRARRRSDVEPTGDATTSAPTIHGTAARHPGRGDTAPESRPLGTGPLEDSAVGTGYDRRGAGQPWLAEATPHAPAAPVDHPRKPVGALRVPEDVAWVDIAPDLPGAGGVCLARVPEGSPLVLNDSAALIWHTAQEVPDSALARTVAAATGESTQDLEREVRRFASDLVRAGFLARADGCRSPDSP